MREHLETMGLGSPYIESMTVSEILGAICKYQGIFVEGEVQGLLSRPLCGCVEIHRPLSEAPTLRAAYLNPSTRPASSKNSPTREILLQQKISL